MAYILNLETSTKNCSVSVCFKGNILSIKELKSEKYVHSENLHFFIKQTLQEAAISINQIQAVAIGKGPGSYTGLRIGVSAAKGICFAMDVPLIAVDSLEILARSVVVHSGWIVPMFYLRKMEVYVAIFDKNYYRIKKTSIEVLNEPSFLEYLKKEQSYYFVGDGSLKLKNFLDENKHIHFIKGKNPSTQELGRMSYEYFLKKQFEKLAYFEPFYLKNFK